VYAGVPEVLEELYRLTEYPSFVRVKPAGERRSENLAMLSAKARAFEESSYSGIFDFVRYIERLEKYEVDSGEAGGVAAENAVRIMSIHKSKGLEAPVVFVAGLSKKFNKQDVRAGVVLHPELGIGMDFKDEVLRIKAPTLYKKVIAGQLNYELLAEELRILYVALTRAREKLILSATVGTGEKFFKKVNSYHGEGPASYLTLSNANTYLDFLAPVLANCVARGSISVTEPEGAVAMEEEAVGRAELLARLRAERYEELFGKSAEEVQDAGIAEELFARGEYRYPYPLSKGKTKLSVSELKKAAYAEEMQEELFPETEPEKRIPKFLQEKTEAQGTMSGSERGTLYHRVMECMDFTKEYGDISSVEAELLRLAEEGRLRKDVTTYISPEKIFGFFRTEIGARMQAAAGRGSLRKEQPFVIGLPYSEVYKDEGAEQNKEYVMVQGIIDACFEEDGALVLVDYKTDAVKDNVREELTRRYRTQMEYYDRALRQMTGKEVKERVIYAFANGEGFSV
jgi:ATP-dependent helicase/nuclease subunit A